MGLNEFEEWRNEMKQNKKGKRALFFGALGSGFVGCFFILCILALGWLFYAAIVFLCWALLEWAMSVQAPTTAGVFAIAFILMVLTALFGRGSKS